MSTPLADIQPEIRRHFRHNFLVSLLDGSFFGFALGFASTVTVLPLFISTLTDSTTLIGLIASIQYIGWLLPQVFTARRTAKESRFKPMTLRLGLIERAPWLFLAGLALLVTRIPDGWALVLTFLIYSWHSLAGGLVATPYQSMIGKIMPPERRGMFYGTQSAGYSLLSGVGAALAGIILAAVAYPLNFAICFFLALVLTLVSWLFLASIREPPAPPPEQPLTPAPLWRDLWDILRRDHEFRRFSLARICVQFTLIGMNFYTIFAVRRFDLPPDTIGVMTSVLLFAQTLGNPISGWLGDRIGHRFLFAAGTLAMGAANLLATGASDPNSLYLAFALTGLGSAAVNTATLTLAVAFGSDHERPYYVSLGNSLVAPFALAAPLISGWLVDFVSYDAMFALTAVAALLTAGITLVKSSTFARTPLPADP
jgi:MFS family permease